ncbi:Saccharopine dehydrogenase-domain-containing protein [Gorgonomyces haynaldii]|nr:Saccharopine dehydrogenase-domain-containing protein [Gorgonomyces haynaldii]
MTNKKFDLIVYGATGFTGQRICHEICKLSPSNPQGNLVWAICGRDAKKLDQLLESLDLSIVSKPAVIVCDVFDPQLKEIVASGRVLISCVGPFRYYGEPVVDACIEGKTDYVDICGETEFIEKMYADHNQRALEQECCIVPACGYDSVPADIGALFLKNEFQKQQSVCTSAEMIVQFHNNKGMQANATTFISAVESFANVSTLRALRKRSHKKIDFVGQSLVVYRSPKWHKSINAYLVPAPVADVPVVKLSQQIMEQHKTTKFSNNFKPLDLTPIQFAGYFAIKSYVGLFYVSWLGFILSLGAKFPFVRNLLKQYPDFFTFGVFKSKGPSQEALDNSSFETRLLGHGYDGPIEGSPNKHLTAIVSGPEMGYITTPICAVTSASMLLNARTRELIPHGVMTPASAFQGVLKPFVDRCKKRGLIFSLEQQ